MAVDLLSPSVLDYKETSKCAVNTSPKLQECSRRYKFEKDGSIMEFNLLKLSVVLQILNSPANLQWLIKLAATCWSGCQGGDRGDRQDEIENSRAMSLRLSRTA